MKIEISRRQFLKATGALVVAFGWPIDVKSQPASAALRSSGGPLPPNQLDSWLIIQKDGMITVMTGKVELGTDGHRRASGFGRARKCAGVGLSRLDADSFRAPQRERRQSSRWFADRYVGGEAQFVRRPNRRLIIFHVGDSAGRPHGRMQLVRPLVR
jgi:hypothetical protein